MASRCVFNGDGLTPRQQVTHAGFSKAGGATWDQWGVQMSWGDHKADLGYSYWRGV